MKKIAVFTLPLNNYNYGGILQAFALQTFLKEKFGVEVQHVDRQYNISLLLRFKIYCYTLIKPQVKNSKQKYFKPISQFIYTNLNVSNPIYNNKQLNKYLNTSKIDLLITGSDQVWRKAYALNISDDFFLNLPYSCVKISYAASFGNDDYKNIQIRENLKSLQGISIREKEACDYLNTLGIETFHHIDPTLLLHKKIYNKLAEKSPKDYSSSIAVYMLDKSAKTNAMLDNLVIKTGLKTCFVGDKIVITEDNYLSVKSPIDGVEDWLKALRDAEYIITDSFHGCVFAILFNKQFITIGNESRGLSRFTSLLEKFGLEDRLVSVDKNYDVLFTPIDFFKINNLIDELRQDAFLYFKRFID